MSSSIWAGKITLDEIARRSVGSFSDLLGIEFTELGTDYLVARMNVEPRMHQPFGVLHGGASVALAETVGSAAANCVVDQTKTRYVGQSINANHLRPVSAGFIFARATPFSLDLASQVWGIEIRDEKGALTCVCRLTMAVLSRTASATAQDS